MRWECLVGGKGLRPGVQVTVRHGDGGRDITATILAETESGGRVVAFDPPVEEWLWDVGEVPLPPYIHEPLADPERYQTVYSRSRGRWPRRPRGCTSRRSCCWRCASRGVSLAFVTLHIGLDTFRPVQVEEIEQHRIHREWAELSADTARAVNETRLAGGRVVAVGTTVVRTLESAAKIALGYRPCDDVPAGAVCGWQRVAAFTGETDLFIRPGHRLPRGGRDGHQLPPAEVHPADAGQRVRRERADRPGLRRGDSGAVSVLQFRGCDVDRVGRALF